MAKKDEATTETGTPVEPTENQILFGELTADDKTRVGFTDEELAGMEDEEPVEAEATEEAAEGETKTAKEAPEEAEEEVATEGEEAEAPEGVEAAEATETEAEAEGETKDEAEAQPETAEEIVDDPLFDTRSVLPGEWALPEKARETLTELDQKAAALATSFDEGNLSASEYRQQADALDQQRLSLRSDIREAERAFSKAQMHWEQRSVAKFLRDNPEWKTNETMLTMLDAEVRRLQAASNDPFDPRHLLNASRNLKRAMGIAPKAKKDKEVKAEKPKGNPVPKGEKPRIPPTLARVPNDQINDVDGGRFARLDRLAQVDPLGYQDALTKLSPTERDEYLSAA